MPEIEELVKDETCFLVQGPMCHWGMQIPGQTGFVRNETKWLTSSAVLAKILDKRCCNFTEGGVWHRRSRVLGGRCKAAIYPPKLVATVLEGFRNQMLGDSQILHAYAAGPVNDEPEPPRGEWDDDGDGGCIDDSKGGILDKKQVLEARKAEMAWLQQQSVHIKVPLEEALQSQGRLLDT
jgi:hypothetical protein